MDAAGELPRRVGDGGEIAEKIDRDAADRRQEDLEIGPRHQLRKHAARELEEAAAQIGFGDGEALGDAGQIPHRLDRRLCHPRRAIVAQDRAVGLQASGGDRLLQLGHVDMRLGDCDRRANVPAGLELVGEDF